MQFNFSCWALCAIEVETDEDDPGWRGYTPKILDFYLTGAECLNARIHIERKALAEHEARYKVVKILDVWKIIDMTRPDEYLALCWTRNDANRVCRALEMYRAGTVPPEQETVVADTAPNTNSEAPHAPILFVGFATSPRPVCLQWWLV